MSSVNQGSGQDDSGHPSFNRDSFGSRRTSFHLLLLMRARAGFKEEKKKTRKPVIETRDVSRAPSKGKELMAPSL